MGTGKVLPTLVIFGVLAMMIFSILPAYANHLADGVCPGGSNGKSPWEIHNVGIGDQGDANENGHICHNHKSTMTMDDRILKT